MVEWNSYSNLDGEKPKELNLTCEPQVSLTGQEVDLLVDSWEQPHPFHSYGTMIVIPSSPPFIKVRLTHSDINKS